MRGKFARLGETSGGNSCVSTTPCTHPPPPPAAAAGAPPQAVRGNVEEVLREKDQRGQREALQLDLDLVQVCMCCGAVAQYGGVGREGRHAVTQQTAGGGTAAVQLCSTAPTMQLFASLPPPALPPCPPYPQPLTPHCLLPSSLPHCHAVQVLDRNVENLSGGELQRFAIAVVAAQEGEQRRRAEGLAPAAVAALCLCCVAALTDPPKNNH